MRSTAVSQLQTFTWVDSTLLIPLRWLPQGNWVLSLQTVLYRKRFSEELYLSTHVWWSCASASTYLPTCCTRTYTDLNLSPSPSLKAPFSWLRSDSVLLPAYSTRDSPVFNDHPLAFLAILPLCFVLLLLHGWFILHLNLRFALRPSATWTHVMSQSRFITLDVNTLTN